MKNTVQKYKDVARKHIEVLRQKLGPNFEELRVSDITTDQGNGQPKIQWVDLVLAGGGMLGIALVGYIYVLEEAGIRFRGVGGTSAGAINAMLIVANRTDPVQKSTEGTLKSMAALDFENFMDSAAKSPVLAILDLLKHKDPKTILRALLTSPGLIKVIYNIVRHRGIFPGKYFHSWIKDELGKNGIRSVADLEKKLDFTKIKLTHLKTSEAAVTFALAEPGEGDPVATLQRDGGKLAIIAHEVSTQSKIELPAYSELFYTDAKQANPGDFVRASMSIPIFFQPFEIPSPDPPDVEAWKKHTKFVIDTSNPSKNPKKATFVDGGTLSNFPINIFHVEPGKPIAFPTFGVQLGVDRGALQPTDTVLNLYRGMNNSSRHILDREFISKNPDYKQLVSVVDTTHFDWLDFKIDEHQKLQLFEAGAQEAQKFLSRWTGQKWDEYKKIRSSASP